MVYSLLDAIKKHKKAYEDDEDDEDENMLGTAAALQAIKLFNSGETEKQGKGALLGLAMSEASKVSISSPRFCLSTLRVVN